MSRTGSLFWNYAIEISASPQASLYSWSYLVFPSKRYDYSVINPYPANAENMVSS
jgi:hypothetical protein